MSETLTKIRRAILGDAEAAILARHGLRHATEAERRLYEQQLEQIAAMKHELMATSGPAAIGEIQ